MIDEVESGPGVRRRCKILSLRRQTYYRRKAGHRPEEEDARIAGLLRQKTAEHVSWGFWMIFHLLRREGYAWNHKRVYRVWKAEELHLRRRPSRPKLKRKYEDLLAPGHVNQGWAMDFLSDWVVGEDKQSVRLFNLVDECSRMALWTEAHKSIRAKKVTDILDKVIEWRGKPQYIRCDNGTEFTSSDLETWASTHGIELKFIQPGKPSQNGIIERLNGTLRKECLNLEWFDSIEQLNSKLQQWWHIYNYLRPHSSLGYKTPDEVDKETQKFYFQSVAA